MDDLAASWPAFACSTGPLTLLELQPVRVSDPTDPNVKIKTREPRWTFRDRCMISLLS
jgi:hypothetical protein